MVDEHDLGVCLSSSLGKASLDDKPNSSDWYETHRLVSRLSCAPSPNANENVQAALNRGLDLMNNKPLPIQARCASPDTKKVIMSHPSTDV
jgi:hypothetical protein